MSPEGESDDTDLPEEKTNATEKAPSLATEEAEEGGTDPRASAFDPADDPGLAAGGAREAEVAPAEPPPPSPAERLPSILESLLLVADRPLSVQDLADLVAEPDPMKIETALTLLSSGYGDRGIQLHPVAGGWQLRTNPQNAAWVQRLLDKKPVRLTRAQLETMAIVGYRQPITRPEIDEIRGVDSGGTLKTLLDRSLVRILGKKEEPGRPLLYGTTKEFLEFFNLRDLADLPTLREFHELSEEHQAQVAALEGAAAPGTIEPAEDPNSPKVAETIARVELPNEQQNDEDLAQVSALIDEAGKKAEGAAKAIGVADAKEREPAAPEGGSDGSAA
jgi:segregation and condensation protein B